MTRTDYGARKETAKIWKNSVLFISTVRNVYLCVSDYDRDQLMSDSTSIHVWREKKQNR